MKSKPFALYSDEPVTDYPLNKTELQALALYWSEQSLDLDTMYWVYGSELTRDYLRFAADRLEKIAAILGRNAIKVAHAEAERLYLKRTGTVAIRRRVRRNTRNTHGKSEKTKRPEIDRS